MYSLKELLDSVISVNVKTGPWWKVLALSCGGPFHLKTFSAPAWRSGEPFQCLEVKLWKLNKSRTIWLAALTPLRLPAILTWNRAEMCFDAIIRMYLACSYRRFLRDRVCNEYIDFCPRRGFEPLDSSAMMANQVAHFLGLHMEDSNFLANVWNQGLYAVDRNMKMKKPHSLTMNPSC